MWSGRALDAMRSEEHTSELQSLRHLVCRLLLEKKKQPGDISWPLMKHSQTSLGVGASGESLASGTSSFGRCVTNVGFFFFNYTAPTEIYTFSLHDALPIYVLAERHPQFRTGHSGFGHGLEREIDRKSTRLNSSHLGISYAVFCLKKNN